MTAKSTNGASEEPSTLLIREIAYYRWEGQGRPCGTALEDWLFAEATLKGEKHKETPLARPKKSPTKH